MKLVEDKIHIGNSMRTNLEFLYDTNNKRFYSRHKHGGVDEIELDELSIKGLLNSLKQDRDRLEWSIAGKKLFPNNAPKAGNIGQNKIVKGEIKMNNVDVKRIIKEELIKALYTRLKKTKLSEAKKFKPGDMYSDDFDYNGMLKFGMKAKVGSGDIKKQIKILHSLFSSFEDVNYHTAAAPLWDALKLYAQSITAAKKFPGTAKGLTTKADSLMKQFNKNCAKEYKTNNETVTSSKRRITEKFASKKIQLLSKQRDFKGNEFFSASANSYGIAWDKVPDSAVTMNKPNGGSNFINFFFVEKRKENPYAGNSWDGSVYEGLIGATKGKKSIYVNRGKWHSKNNDARTGVVTKPSQRMAQIAGLHNFKRYSEVADKVWTIDISEIADANKELKANRIESKKGATALMKAEDMAKANIRRYNDAIAIKVAAGGPKDMDKFMDSATKLLSQTIEKNTKMLKAGKYHTSWKDYQTISNDYRRMVDVYRRYKESAAQDIKEPSEWRKDYTKQYMKDLRDLFRDMQKNIKEVNAGPQKKIEAY